MMTNRRFALLVSLVVFAAGALFGYGVRESETVSAQSVTSLSSDATPTLLVDVQGRLLVACLDGIHTEGDLVASLRRIRVQSPRLVQLVGYVDWRGDVQMLTESMLIRSSRRNFAAPTGEPK